MLRKILLLSLIAQIGIPILHAQSQASNQVSERKKSPASIEGPVRQQVHPQGATQQNSIRRLNDRLSSMNELARHARNYTLGPGDVIEVTVIGIPAVENKEFTLDAQGTISLPYVGEVRLLDLTTRETEAEIASLFETSLVLDPQVTVRIQAYRSRFFYVFGEVEKPGVNQLTGDTFLLDALTLAGGLTEKADTRIQIHHGGFWTNPSVASTEASPSLGPQAAGAGEQTSTTEVDLIDLLEKGDMRRNIRIQSGDVISVPERMGKFFFVLGDVPNPGPYPMPKNEDVTLSQAVAMAGGLLATASGKKTTIMRPNPDGVSATQIQVNAAALLEGKGRDVEILENDIVLVPGSAGKTMGRSFMAGITGFLTSLLLVGIR
jgi:polysaccharide export outer membrane protein